jgi:hypothetical protein
MIVSEDNKQPLVADQELQEVCEMQIIAEIIAFLNIQLNLGPTKYTFSNSLSMKSWLYLILIYLVYLIFFNSLHLA